MIEHICNGSSTNAFFKGCSSNSGGGGDSSSKIRTYKRRKLGINGSSSSLTVKVEDFQTNSCDQVFDLKVNGHSHLNGSDDCCFHNGCIRDALNIPRTSEAKEILDSRDGQNRNSNVSSIDFKGLSALACNGSSGESGHSADSKMCERVYTRIFTSEGFSELRKLVSTNFNGLDIEEVPDFSLVNTRLTEGAYESSPMLFSSDIQQMWNRLHSIGSEMVSLANSLSDLSRTFCRDMLSTHDSKVRSQWEEPSTSVFCTCRQCGEKSDGRDCLICDSCEEMFHVSCIQPPLKEIPHKIWYCANCPAGGIDTIHEDCAVCQRKLNAMLRMNKADTVPVYDELEESSDGTIETGVQVFNGNKRLSCKVCGCMFSNGEEYRACEHRFCQYKYYHIRCLTNKQLKSYGPRWYCPSCLCRVCLTDKDDDDLVMCDGCDHGYHIYCMNPPLSSIPEGKWFCTKCDVGLQAIRESKKLYEGLERKEMKNQEKTESHNSSKKIMLDFEETVSGPGGMDMLLTAAKTLNEEELGTLNGIQ